MADAAAATSAAEAGDDVENSFLTRTPPTEAATAAAAAATDDADKPARAPLRAPRRDSFLPRRCCLICDWLNTDVPAESVLGVDSSKS